MARASRRIGACAVFVALAASRRAVAAGGADRVATAQGLYESAVQLIKAGGFEEACPKLEESQRLDPAMGTQFFLAACYESTGRPTKAWSLFLEVAAVAKAAGNGVREATARQRAAVLEPRLPRITVFVDAPDATPPGLRVLRDDVLLTPVIWGSPIPIDLGPHTVRATASGKVPWETTVVVRELGQKAEVHVPALVDAPPAGDVPPGGDVPAHVGAADGPAALRRGLPGQRIAALAVGSAGLAGIAVGSALGLLARSAWSQADAACPTHRACSVAAHEESVQSASLATGSTIAFVSGGAAVAGGVALWFATASPRAAARLWISPTTGGARVEGAF